MYKKIKKYVCLCLTGIVLSSCISVVYASDVFDGWNDDNKSVVWAVYETTDWRKMQKDLILNTARSGGLADVPYYVRDEAEDMIRQALKNINGGLNYYEDYVEIMLAMTHVLQGGVMSDDPCNIKTYIDPEMENMTQLKSYETLARNFFFAERLYNSTHNDDVSVVRMDDALMTVIQGTLYGSHYIRSGEEYSKESSDAYFSANKSKFEEKGIKEMRTHFADEVAEVYTTISVSGGGIVIVGNGQFTNPHPGCVITSEFGYRGSEFHNGIDLAIPGGSEGHPTYAAADGTVIIAGWSDSAGYWVVIDHGGGLVTKYMHHSQIIVSAGQTVRKGQMIGYAGNTGNSFGAHLHFQVEVNGVAVNPRPYFELQ